MPLHYSFRVKSFSLGNTTPLGDCVEFNKNNKNSTQGISAQKPACTPFTHRKKTSGNCSTYKNQLTS